MAPILPRARDDPRALPGLPDIVEMKGEIHHELEGVEADIEMIGVSPFKAFIVMFGFYSGVHLNNTVKPLRPVLFTVQYRSPAARGAFSWLNTTSASIKG